VPREGVEIDVSTLAGWAGASVATPDPILDAIRRHVFAAFTRFLEDGRICLSNNAAERALRGGAWQVELDLCRFGRRP
jgi:transposase